MSAFRSRPKEYKRATTRSESSSRSSKSDALSLDRAKGRYPAIDLRQNTDVSTLACVEVSRAILTRPDVNTGKLFKAIAAANYDVNKSDAVIVITAAIMETVGNSVSAKELLRKSRTVSAFYEKMNLNNEMVRTSFVIMLFAVAPEFVKMIESSVKISLERVQSMTSAPHADKKMVDAAGELLKDGFVSTGEHLDLLDTFSNLRVDTKELPSPNSFTETPDEMVGANDSVSQVGKGRIIKDDSPMTQRSLMRYIKGHKSKPAEDFYNTFPDARKPVEAAKHLGRTGLGFTGARSAFTETVTEDGMAEAMDSIFSGFEAPRRHVLTDKDRKSYKRDVNIISPEAFPKSFKARADSMTTSVYETAELAITREDIEEKRAQESNYPSGGSKPDTFMSDNTEDEALLSLL